MDQEKPAGVSLVWEEQGAPLPSVGPGRLQLAELQN